MEISIFAAGIINASPSLIFWIAVVVLATMLLRRRRVKAEKCLLAGAVVMLVSSLLTIPGVAIVPYLVGKGATMTEASSAAWSLNLLRSIIGMAGIICLVYAFWIKFNQKA